MRTLIRVKVDEEKEWFPAWEEALTNYTSLLKEIDQMKHSDAPFVENFARLLEIERVNSPIDIPSTVLYALAVKRVSKMSGIEVIDHNLNCSVSLKTEKLEVKLQPYNSTPVLVQDHEPYEFNKYHNVILLDIVRAYAVPYAEFKAGKISRAQLRKGFMNAQRETVKKEGKKISEFKLLKNSFVDVYMGKFKTVSKFLDSALKQIEEEPLIEERRKEVERKNEEREVERIRILEETGLMDFLKELKDSNIRIQEDGIVHGLKWV